MKAAIFNGTNLEIKEINPPIISASQVLIKVMVAGVCGTDRAIISGDLPVPKLPLIPGHEIVGIVQDLGSNVDPIWQGKRVTCEINSNIDNNCYFCENQNYTQCISRKALGIDIDGGFAQYIAVESYLLHEIPSVLSFEDASFIEPLAAAYQTFEKMPIEEKDRNIVIFGLGKLGLLIIQIALQKKLKVIAVDGSEKKLTLVKSYGEVHTLNRHKIQNLSSEIKKLTGGIGADICVDTSGNPSVLNDIIASCRTCGKIHIKSTHGLQTPVNITDLVVREIQIYTSRCGPFPMAIQGLQSGEIKVNSMISQIYPLEQIQTALDAYNNPDIIKTLIKME
ncbi:zinc-binding dehydrogenase [Candidatus Lokiarchaeum ossiferum]|uniref:zinc-binding dehydrogenase n=1 Tax=Candidatus Lokiarchaeum ossiferum TaxID=2951803 RepID=UPI00352DCD63